MRSERRQRTRLIAVRLLPEEHQAIQDAAADLGVSVSELVRASALNKIGYLPEETTT